MHFVESVSVVNKVAFGWLASASMLSVLKQFHIVSSKNWKSTCEVNWECAKMMWMKHTMKL